jgi:hypothetical protein
MGSRIYYFNRIDPYGRSHLNANIFTGDIIVTDFGDIPELGNIQTTSLQGAYENWKSSKIAKEISCSCSGVACLGPIRTQYISEEQLLSK